MAGSEKFDFGPPVSDDEFDFGPPVKEKPPGKAMEWDVPSAGKAAQYTKTPLDKVAELFLPTGEIDKEWLARTAKAKGVTPEALEKHINEVQLAESIPEVALGTPAVLHGVKRGAQGVAILAGKAARVAEPIVEEVPLVGKLAKRGVSVVGKQGQKLENAKILRNTAGKPDPWAESFMGGAAAEPPPIPLAAPEINLATTAQRTATITADPVAAKQAENVATIAKQSPEQAAKLHKAYASRSPAYRSAYAKGADTKEGFMQRVQEGMRKEELQGPADPDMPLGPGASAKLRTIEQLRKIEKFRQRNRNKLPQLPVKEPIAAE